MCLWRFISCGNIDFGNRVGNRFSRFHIVNIEHRELCNAICVCFFRVTAAIRTSHLEFDIFHNIVFRSLVDLNCSCLKTLINCHSLVGFQCVNLCGKRISLRSRNFLDVITPHRQLYRTCPVCADCDFADLGFARRIGINAILCRTAVHGGFPDDLGGSIQTLLDAEGRIILSNAERRSIQRCCFFAVRIVVDDHTLGTVGFNTPMSAAIALSAADC